MTKFILRVCVSVAIAFCSYWLFILLWYNGVELTWLWLLILLGCLVWPFAPYAEKDKSQDATEEDRRQFCVCQNCGRTLKVEGDVCSFCESPLEQNRPHG